MYVMFRAEVMVWPWRNSTKRAVPRHWQLPAGKVQYPRRPRWWHLPLFGPKLDGPSSASGADQVDDATGGTNRVDRAGGAVCGARRDIRVHLLHPHQPAYSPRLSPSDGLRRRGRRRTQEVCWTDDSRRRTGRKYHSPFRFHARLSVQKVLTRKPRRRPMINRASVFGIIESPSVQCSVDRAVIKCRSDIYVAGLSSS